MKNFGSPDDEAVRLPPLRARHAAVPRAWMLAGGGAALFGVLMLGACCVYRAPSSGAARVFAAVIPYPAAMVGMRIIPMGEYFDARAAHAAYVRMAPSADGTKESPDILTALVNRRLTERIARRLGIAPEAKDVDTMMNEIITGAGGKEALVSGVRKTFGWSLNTFRRRIVEPVAFANQVNRFVLADASVQAEARARAEQAVSRLAKGEAFAQVADAFNAPGGLVGPGGDLGYRSREELPEAWKAAVAGLAQDQYTSILNETDRFTVLLLTDRIRTGDDAQTRLSAIVIPKRTFADLLAEERSNAFIRTFIGS